MLGVPSMRLRRESELNLARENQNAFPRARRIRDNILATAARWAGLDDQDLRRLIPDASVPRSFECSFEGCPVHGKEVFARGGWAYDPWQERWKLTCPVGRESYPSNDFGAFYAGGMKDGSLLTGPYADDGWGWLAAGAAKKHWFVGLCCERLWTAHIVPGALALSRAYLLTGEKSFAQKAATMLARIAEVYPQMDYHRQSMYATEFSPSYTGKITILIHETLLAESLCEAYDNISDLLTQDESLASLLRENLLQEVIRGIYEGHIRGNYGMHQLTLLTAALALGDEQQKERAINWVLNNTGEKTALKEMETLVDGYIFRDKAAHAEGLNFGVDNLIFREGLGWESSPGYLRAWADRWAAIAAMLKPLGTDISQMPKLRRMWRVFSEMKCLDDFVPSIGDTGSAVSGRVEFSNETARALFDLVRDPDAAALLLKRGIFAGDSFTAYEDLFRPALERGELQRAAANATPATAGANMGGYGLAILRSGHADERAAAAIYYGRAATEHAHFDRLNLELFAYGKKMIPDLGYGETAAETREPAAWSKNTASHATVVVDERRQDSQAAGQLRCFVSAPGVEYVDVCAPYAYRAAPLYRRAVALITLSPTSRYLLDVFRVSGGEKHDSSTHGFPASFSTAEIALSPPQTAGTLPGENAPIGSYYDDPELGDPFKTRSFYTYRGSGYSYFYDVQKGRPDAPWTATWLDDQDKAGLRMTFLPPFSDEVVLANARLAQNRGNPDSLKYLLLRNQGRPRSTFASLIEPFKGSPAVRDVTALRSPAGESNEQTGVLAFKASHRDGVDFLFQALDMNAPTQFEGGIEFKGRFGLLRLDKEGRLIQATLVGAGRLKCAGSLLEIPASLAGTVGAVQYSDHSLQVAWDEDAHPLLDPALLEGETAIISNDAHFTSYAITRAQLVSDQGAPRRRYLLTFGEDEFRIGKFLVSATDPQGRHLSTDTYLYLADQGYYRGTRLVNAPHTLSLPIQDIRLSPHSPGQARSATIQLASPHPLSPAFSTLSSSPANLACIYDFGPGDRIQVIPHASLLAGPQGYRLYSNCRPTAESPVWPAPPSL